MGKQGIGIPMLNIHERLDTLLHVLDYPQKPMVYTKTSQLAELDEMPAGFEATVLIACIDGFNMEDAIIINRKCLDLGMARSTYYRTYKDVEQKLGNHYTEEIKIPDSKKCYGRKRGSYEKLEEDGLIQMGTPVSQDDILIGKISPYISSTDTKFTEKDHSTLNKNTEYGIVDRVLISTNDDGFKIPKVRVRSTRIPEVGDKYSSRHGQKGVIGDIKNPEDLPFSVKDGIVPDIIINPHCS